MNPQLEKIKELRAEINLYGGYIPYEISTNAKLECKAMGLDPHLVFCSKSDFDSIIKTGNFKEFKA